MSRLATLVICLLVLACKPAQKTSSSQQGKYYEDLSAYRPKVEEPQVTDSGKTVSDQTTGRNPKEFVPATSTINTQLGTVLDSIDTINLTQRFLNGFSIQVYLGPNREAAMEIRKELISVNSDIESFLLFNQPNFNVRAGRYFTRLEAQQDYQILKKHFPGAIVVPDKIPIK